jgi:hypothetical protein
MSAMKPMREVDCHIDLVAMQQLAKTGHNRRGGGREAERENDDSCRLPACPETGRVPRDLNFMPRLSGHPLPGVSGHLGVAGLWALPPGASSACWKRRGEVARDDTHGEGPEVCRVHVDGPVRPVRRAVRAGETFGDPGG